MRYRLPSGPGEEVLSRMPYTIICLTTSYQNYL
ncbi:hypothetical protein FG465_003564 [Yersinia enterocolitica]|nr:hypothetical protein [Yersinia enterocolitica]ELW7381414.1 hypothetical protein [Yersinia enterocolitica]HEI6777065.1 hypothetical protein [Yersinia enterocolitica]HEI6781322.1 hypothetical protein [Yersinia enterocolitica]HEI6840521.1 hypothetical protein [Yersinia enterocolitica]